MSVPDYTLVCGIDAKHFEQLSMVWMTWKLHKPSLLEHPMILFVDRENPVDVVTIHDNIDHPDLTIVDWPPREWEITYPETIIDKKEKFGKAQRYKMMAGFVHVPAAHVQTPYWLKLDSDAIALADDDWIDPEWFEDLPDVVGHRWGFTKPANSIQLLDEWYVQNFKGVPLNLPFDNPESERISHPRICSWCALFNTAFTRDASTWAIDTCGHGMLPVPSQDTYLWYLATVGDPESVLRVNMKERGWTYRSSFKSVRSEVLLSLGIGEDRGL